MNDARGFTLTELIIAVGLSLLVASASWSFYQTQLKSLTDQAANLDATENARAAISFMVREIRFAGLDSQESAFSTAGLMGLNEATVTSILIQADIDRSGAIDPNAVDPNAEQVAYAYDAGGERILRTVAGTTQTLIKNVPAGGFGFRYFDDAGNELVPSTGTPAALTAAQRDQVAIVRLDLEVEAAHAITPQTIDLSSRATLRNRILERL